MKLAAALFAAAMVVGLPLTAAPRPAAQLPVARVEIVRSTFLITLRDGHILTPQELPGVELDLGDGSGQQRHIRIDAAEPDPTDQTGEIILYTLSEREPDSGRWRNLCLPDPDGHRFGFPLPGGFTADGRYIAAPGRLLITCTGGAEGKCVRWGYRPWANAPDGTPLHDAYNACVRLVRADYAGDGRGTTRNGQPIDIYDIFGIQTAAYDTAYDFEAGFTADGATCVRHVRVKENAELASIAAAAPRLSGQTGTVCTEAHARGQGALLLVRSPP